MLYILPRAAQSFAAEFGAVGVVVFLSLIFLALVRRVPPGHAWSAIKVLLIFFILGAMVSGDIFEDRTTWGLLLLLLLADVSSARGRVPAVQPMDGIGELGPSIVPST